MAEEIAASSGSERNAFKGIIFAVLASGVLMLSDLMKRSLSTRFDGASTYALLFACNIVLLVVLLAPAHGTALFRTQRTALVILRGGCLAIAALTTGLALTYVSLSNVWSISFLAPIFLLIAADLALKEQVSNVQLVATVGGFAGAMLITMPDFSLNLLGPLFAGVAVVATVSYAVLSRLLIRTETTMSLLVWEGVVGLLVFGLLGFTAMNLQAFTFVDIVLFASAGGLMTLGNFLFITAFRNALAATIAPVMYMQLFWAGSIGMLIFGEPLRANTMLGIALVAGATSGLAIYAQLSNRRSPTG